MEKDLISEIEKSMDSFSKGQKKIAEYIIKHYDKAAFITASKLGEVVGVSESTVVRFAVELGYQGYPKLQKALQELIRNKLTSVQRMEIITSKLNEQNILKTVLMADIDKLNKTIEEIDNESFNGSVATILKAKKIYVIGTRSCYSIANFLGFYLNHIFPDVKIISTNSASETFEQIYRVDKDDVVIAISFPRYSRRTINALKYANEKKSSIIAITDSLNSPITENATYTLTARCDMSSFVDSLVAPLSIINALIVALVMEKKDEVVKTLSHLEDIWDEYEVYEKFSQK
ncbi:MAG: MurR/RpiR family transcriptional regulator [Ruminococcaceae bacterium]|nr:MurR/RpiR family transcriptional regulator [Oscillospiraceae bacterium]